MVYKIGSVEVKYLETPTFDEIRVGGEYGPIDEVVKPYDLALGSQRINLQGVLIDALKARALQEQFRNKGRVYVQAEGFNAWLVQRTLGWRKRHGFAYWPFRLSSLYEASKATHKPSYKVEIENLSNDWNILGDAIVGFPPNSKNLEESEQSFLRVGKDGSEVIDSKFNGDEFIGKVLNKKWDKDDDGSILGPFVAKIVNGELQLTGKSNNGSRYGWVTSKNRIYLFDEVVIDVHLKVSGLASSNSFYFDFYLEKRKGVAPYTDDDYLRVFLGANASNYFIRATKCIEGTPTNLFAQKNITNAQGTFRFKLQPDDGHFHLYFHDGAGDINESQDELTTEGSPFILDIIFDEAYVSYELWTMDTTNKTVSSEKVVPSYPKFQPKFDLDDVDEGKGDVKIFDTRNEASEALWQRVLDRDHVFVGDCVVENGLIRLWIDEGVVNGLKLYYWTGSIWDLISTGTYAFKESSPQAWMNYPFLKNINEVSVEKVVIEIRLKDSAIQDYYLDAKITLKRGEYSISFDPQRKYPTNDFTFITCPTSTHFAYVQDAKIADADISLAAPANTNPSDNFVVWIDESKPVLMFFGANKKPSTSWSASTSTTLYYKSITESNISTLVFYLGLIPFPQIAYLFKEAEDATYGAGATIDETQGDDSGHSVLLNAQNEYVWYDFIAGTHLPQGRYIAFYRLKESKATSELDARLEIYETTTHDPRNEENYLIDKDLTNSFAYYGLVFDVLKEDVESTKTIRIRITKLLAIENSIWVDYFLIVPISDGESWSQDLAHQAMANLKEKTFKPLKR